MLLNTRNKFGTSVQYHSLSKISKPLVEYFVDKGVFDINSSDKYCTGFVSEIISYGQFEIGEYLIKKFMPELDKFGALAGAAKSGNLKFVKLLGDEVSDINGKAYIYRDNSGPGSAAMRPLIHAVNF